MISIIVALYNEEKNIEKCISSVLVQTLIDFELVLVDDGSTDNSGLICDKYKTIDSRIKVIHEQNSGLISARMCGIENCNGDYITFLDCDDWVEKNFYEELYAPINLDKTIDISISSVLDETKYGIIKNRFESHVDGYIEPTTAILEMYRGKYYDWSGCGKIYKKEIVLDFVNSWWFKDPLGEDAEWNWKVFHVAKKIYFVSKPGYHYYENLDSMTHKKIDMKNLVLIDRFERMVAEIGKGEDELKEILWTIIVRKTVERITRMICYEDNNNNEIEKCRKTLNNIPDNVLETLPVGIIKKINLYKSDWSEVLAKKNEKDNALIIAYKELLNTGAKEIYVYGAGAIGEYVGYYVANQKLEYEGYVVSDTKNANGKLNDKKIISINEISNKEEVGILLALNATNKSQVKKFLEERKFYNYIDVGESTFYY